VGKYLLGAGKEVLLLYWQTRMTDQITASALYKQMMTERGLQLSQTRIAPKSLVRAFKATALSTELIPPAPDPTVAASLPAHCKATAQQILRGETPNAALGSRNASRVNLFVTEAHLDTVYGVRVLVELMELGLLRNDTRSGIVAISQSFHSEVEPALQKPQGWTRNDQRRLVLSIRKAALEF